MNTSRSRRRARHAVVVPVLLAALTGLAACGSSDEPTGPTDGADRTSTPASPAGADETGTLALVADGSMAAGKCAVPSAETLATFDTAFEGTVQSVDGGTVTLAVDEWYAGSEAQTVTVEAPSKQLRDLLMAVRFEEGRTYLVSAVGDRVTLCGFTAEKSGDLEALYAQAFAA